MSSEPLNLVAAAYLTLLRIPLTSDSRWRVQGALAQCRDELARLSKKDPEDIQNQAERIAAAWGEL